MLKSTDVARATRLLHRGGTTSTRPQRRRSGGRHPNDPAWTSRRSKTATVDSEDADDADAESVADDITSDETNDETEVRRATASSVEAPEVRDEIDDDEADTAETEDSTDAELADADSSDADADAEYEDADADADYEDAEYEDSDADSEYEDSEYEDAEYEEFDEDSEYEDEADLTDETDDLDEDQYDDYARSARGTADSEREQQPAKRSERPARASAYSIDGAGREMRYRERQRVTIGLFVLVLAAIVSGVFLGLPGWVATGVTGVILLAYLFYLRRTVMAENKIRAQRIARAQRSRREEAERRRRAEQTPEFAAAPPPPRLRRPGGATVLEIDDEDPVFDHLPPYQHRRMAREDVEFRRVG